MVINKVADALGVSQRQRKDQKGWNVRRSTLSLFVKCLAFLLLVEQLRAWRSRNSEPLQLAAVPAQDEFHYLQMLEVASRHIPQTSSKAARALLDDKQGYVLPLEHSTRTRAAYSDHYPKFGPGEKQHEEQEVHADDLSGWWHDVPLNQHSQPARESL